MTFLAKGDRAHFSKYQAQFPASLQELFKQVDRILLQEQGTPHPRDSAQLLAQALLLTLFPSPTPMWPVWYGSLSPGL